jgi:hypothetical protein
MQMIYASGASAMSGTLAASALANTGLIPVASLGQSIYTVRVTLATTHGIVAGSQLYFSNLDNVADDIYFSDKMRYVAATPAGTTMDVSCPEGYTAGTPTTGELWGAGYVSDEPWWFAGYKLHLSAAEAAGETLTLAVDAKRGSAWDVVVQTKPMIGVADIIYFPSEPIPIVAKDVLKFTWANTGGRTWGLELWVAPRV